jgi:NADH:ubiquinone oxidoreductase subunit F (NADH-binding)/Pyruvate/2-oxoacid:ferredoxin oxidoreductase delta subunit/(2Fe-2S) ferredoxin
MTDNTGGQRIYIGMGTCGLATGAEGVLTAVHEGFDKLKIEVPIVKTGCIGMCAQEVLLDVVTPGRARVTYRHVKPEMVEDILKNHVVGGQPMPDLALGQIIGEGESAYDGIPSYMDLPVYKKQKRIVLRRCGFIDPDLIEDYISTGGYKGIEKAIKTMSPEQVRETVKESGLRGRGGGGFPAGLKWEFCANAYGDQKYLICNADEGDPGAFMDRSVLEGDPHAVLEGMIIAGYAIGANNGYIYCRAEYPLAIKRLQKAIAQAEEKGFLGENILGSGFNFRLKIKAGAGAFVCGEETALMASIEGRRGMPRSRPPFPAVKGLWGKPSNINNVETYACVPPIIVNGAESYASVGTEGTKGTKVFALAGKIVNAGLIEVAAGTELKDIVHEIGGGIEGGLAFKAAQLGGPSGGCIPANLAEIPIDYDSLLEAGAMMGSGGVVVMAEDDCMVDVARYFLKFTAAESCGKCVPCRIGTKIMLEILQRITVGEGRPEDVDNLADLGQQIKKASLCGLGQSAPNPVLSTIRYFRDEYEAHINEGKCPAKRCTALVTYKITDACTGCTLCAKKCPVSAISGERKQLHVIDQELCTKCNMCFEVCPFNAIEKE